ncbi:NAD-dependent succinate-semialdehyde dehydrogenase [Egibacter rhizosphaerae]|uniref:NAD-dependent succinate-semialdehyde dehydrogenase n=1 Tax=Egibacter rhizosphaerae TaxID=1670831 RepID=A0A411YIF3_9ACTN|nr:NAD-dependent succinate-semialdehyde dehydrogenase [Egibacter rhizosphaerae]QBI20909.1 NAD-dependent succinate-semialdehyde dehydrogenase [Egibacter rhizosphaerae]
MSLPEYPDVPADQWIGGRWQPADGGNRFPVFDPATGDVLVEVADGGEPEVQAAVSAAHEAQPAWAATAPRTRGEVLRRAYELLADEQERVARLIVMENGKGLADARGEARYAAEFFRWYAEEAVRLDGDLLRSPSGGNWIMSLRQPVGVALLVTPWNFPAAMGTRKIGPALAAGCSVVLKPASAAPLTSLAIADALHRAGAPAGTVNVVVGSRSSSLVGPALADPRVRKLSFTGSTEVGRTLLQQAAERIVNCSLELGGNAPFIVTEDADLDAAIEGAMIAKMRNGGASCIAANRFLVQERVAAEFRDRLTSAMGGLAMGPGLDESHDVGAMVSDAERDKVADLVARGVEQGAVVQVGGAPPQRPGAFFPPTVLSDVAPDNVLLHEEVFGPVAPIRTFTSDDEAIKAANDTEHGLASYVFTGDLGRGLALSEALESGMVGLNRGFISDPAAPFGGVKQSGIGREGGHDGLLEFCETKYVAVGW